MAHALRGAAAVVGAGLSRFGELPGHNHMEIMAEAVHNAMAEAGVTRHQIDGIFGSNFFDMMTPLSVAEYFGFKPRFMDGTNIGGSSFVNCLQSAAAALQLGLCEVALIAYGSNIRTITRRGRPAGVSNVENVYKPRQPINAYALAASRHMYEFGTTREQLAEVAVAARAWAQKNPAAFMRDPLTIEEVLNARMVVDPFGLRDRKSVV